ncbi:MAG: single-stranded DNA-binding protein [Paludibacteraceae bacterium]|nr:single-stranded DNA-binding protein [Paludibacteraceae bacterium]
MNKCIYIGHLANDVDLRTTGSGKSVCQFRLAVQRRVPNAQGVREADFFTIIMWGKTAENASRWLQKGSKIACECEARTRTYEAQDGSTRYVVEFHASSWEFAGANPNTGSSGQQSQQAPRGQQAKQQAAQPPQDDFTEVDDDELPF